MVAPVFSTERPTLPKAHDNVQNTNIIKDNINLLWSRVFTLKALIDYEISKFTTNVNVKVSGAGTVNTLAKWTPDTNTLGDSLISDDGTDVSILPGAGGNVKLFENAASGETPTLTISGFVATDQLRSFDIGLYSGDFNTAIITGLSTFFVDMAMDVTDITRFLGGSRHDDDVQALFGDASDASISLNTTNGDNFLIQANTDNTTDGITIENLQSGDPINIKTSGGTVNVYGNLDCDDNILLSATYTIGVTNAGSEGLYFDASNNATFTEELNCLDDIILISGKTIGDANTRGLSFNGSWATLNTGGTNGGFIVDGSAQTRLDLYTTTGGSVNWDIINEGNINRFSIREISGGSIFHIYGGATADSFTIDASGNIGINDVTPSYKLDVDGTFRATGAALLDTSLNVGSTIAMVGTLDEDNMASDSATHWATQQSIKAYVDASSTAPGGADTQIQFNDGGAFGGEASLIYNKTNDTLTIDGAADAQRLILQAHSTQTANILEVQNSSADVILKAYQPGNSTDLATVAGGLNSQAALSCYTYNDQTGYASAMAFVKSHTDTIGSNVTTIDTETLGVFTFLGVNSSNTLGHGAQIAVIQDGAAGASMVPAKMIFRTSAGAVYADLFTLQADNTIDFHKPATFEDTSQVDGIATFNDDITMTGPSGGADLDIKNIGSNPNLTLWAVYPGSGTNISHYMHIVPKGIGFGGAVGGLIICGSDYIADSTNYSMMRIGRFISTYEFNSLAAGTGTLYSTVFKMNSVIILTIDTSGNFQINSNQIQDSGGSDAITFDGSQNTTITGNLIVSGTGPNAIGTTVDGARQLIVAGNFTSDGSGNSVISVLGNTNITAASGDTIFHAGMSLTSNITTQTAAESVGNITQLRLDEPSITDNLTGGGVITNASTLLITGAPTEGASNYAILVDSGAVSFGGTLGVTGRLTALNDIVLTAGKAIGATAGNGLSFDASNHATFSNRLKGDRIASIGGIIDFDNVSGSNFLQLSGGTVSLYVGGSLGIAQAAAGAVSIAGELTALDDIVLTTGKTISDTNSGGLSFSSDAATFTNDVTLTSATSDKPDLTLINTNADAESANLFFYKNSASPANNDELGHIYFQGKDDGAVKADYCEIWAQVVDVGGESEASRITFRTQSPGSLEDMVYEEGALDVPQDVRARQLVADNDSTGLAGTTTITNATAAADTNAPTHINTPTGIAAAQAGWMKVYIGTTAAYIPYWTA